MKKIITLLILAASQLGFGQTMYCDFEAVKMASFPSCTGQLDTNYSNIYPNLVDTSFKCAKYIRDTALYDNIVILPYNKFVDITPYATNAGGAPKLKMKVWSSSPIGTRLDLQMGGRTSIMYPTGIHSEYTALTTTVHAWELVTFNYLQTTPGGSVSPTNVDKIIFTYNPGSHARDTIYFDEMMGPDQIVANIEKNDAPMVFKIFQNEPNPVKEYTSVRLQFNSPGFVSIKLYDLLGKQVSTILDQNMAPGSHAVPIDTENIPDGIYFYVVKKGGITQTKKMVVAR
jgi:hypothetical protein